MKIGLATILLFAASFLPSQGSTEQLIISDERMSELGVETQQLMPVSEIWSTSFPAEIVIPNAQVRVVNPILSGLVSALYVAEGDEVTKGQIIAEVSSPGFLQLQQDFIAAFGSYKLAQRNHQRNEELYNEGIISEKSYLGSGTILQEADAELYRARQLLEFSGLSEGQIDDLASKRTMNKNMIILAPFDGFVLKQTISVGEHVDEAIALYHIGVLSPLWIEVHVPYDLRPLLEIGSKISIEGISETSEVISIGAMVHSDDQGILVRGVIENATSKLMPGQFVKAKLEQKTDEGNLYQVPTGALIRNKNLATIFVKNKNGFSIHNVMIIAEQGGTLFITIPLDGGKEIAIKGIATLKGMLEGLGSDE
jgi:cobalt-zinc-cadmium efflux system membrane fusion protein